MTPASAQAEIGVFGGSGFYSFLDDAVEVAVDTPYGPPAAPVTIGDVGGRRVAFLPRHGRRHELLPHRINYRANLWAMREVGVTRLIGPCAAGSLQPEVAPGDFVVPDQLVDRTWGRADTFYEGPVAHHVSYADPYCAELSAVARGRRPVGGHHRAPDRHGDRHPGPPLLHPGRVPLVPQPGFRGHQHDPVPGGLPGPGAGHLLRRHRPHHRLRHRGGGPRQRRRKPLGNEPVTQAEVFGFFKSNLDRVRSLLFDVVAAVPADRKCRCADAVGPLR